MRNMLELAANLLLNRVLNETVCQALALQRQANEERERQTELELNSGKPADFTRAAAFEEGSVALCQALQTAFGALPIHSIQAVKRIAAESNNPYLGRDSKDYLGIFINALEAETAGWVVSGPGGKRYDS
jgi:hypothetical protein